MSATAEPLPNGSVTKSRSKGNFGHLTLLSRCRTWRTLVLLKMILPLGSTAMARTSVPSLRRLALIDDFASHNTCVLGRRQCFVDRRYALSPSLILTTPSSQCSWTLQDIFARSDRSQCHYEFLVAAHPFSSRRNRITQHLCTESKCLLGLPLTVQVFSHHPFLTYFAHCFRFSVLFAKKPDENRIDSYGKHMASM